MRACLVQVQIQAQHFPSESLSEWKYVIVLIGTTSTIVFPCVLNSYRNNDALRFAIGALSHSPYTLFLHSRMQQENRYLNLRGITK